MYTGTDTAIPIPITTRGVGIHSSIYHNCYKQSIKSEPKCTAAQLYRISLLQLDTRMQINYRDNLNLDAEVEITTPLAFSPLLDESKNFRLISEAINSLGNFRLDDANYQPHIPAMPEVDIDVHDGGTERAGSNCSSPEFFDCESELRPITKKLLSDDGQPRRIVPNPYLITIHNLRQVVLAMANPDTPLVERRRFIRRNPIPSAVFMRDLLVNPEEIMPADYDEETITKDTVAFREMVHEMRCMYKHLIENVFYKYHGNISLMSCVYHPSGESFAVQNGALSYSGQSIVRSMGPKDSGYKFNGCCYLMSELLPDVEQNFFGDSALWAIRSRYLSNSSYKTNWVNAITNFNNSYESRMTVSSKMDSMNFASTAFASGLDAAFTGQHLYYQ